MNYYQKLNDIKINHFDNIFLDVLVIYVLYQ